MLERVRQFFTSPTFDDADKTQQARLPHVVLLTMFGISLVMLPVITFVAIRTRDPGSIFASIVIFVFVIATVSLNVLLRRGYIRLPGGVMAALLLFALTFALIATRGGINNPTVIFLGVVVVLAALLVGGPWTLRFTGLTILILSAIYYAESRHLLPGPPPAAPARLYDLLLIIFALSMFGLLLRTATRYMAENEARIRSANQELRELSVSLQQRVDERTRELARRTAYLGAATSIAQEAQVAGGDLSRLLPRVAQVISEQFGFYHIGLFLLDEGKEWAVLQAASSEEGRRMMAQGYRLRVGSQSIVGDVAARGEHHIALDVGQDAVFFDNPNLPETRSEMAVPLRIRGEILGVLDVQSTEPQAFTEEDIAVLQALADQVAMAVNNAQLLRQVEASVEAERRALGQLTREAWQQVLRRRGEMSYRSHQGIVRPVASAEPSPDDHLPTIDIPVRVRGQTIATIQAHKPKARGEWATDEIELVKALAEQLGVALESARLYQDTQRRAARDRLVAEITARVRASTDVDTILRTAILELGRALRVSEGLIQLHGGDGDNIPGNHHP